jgi:hypothetical protein
MNKGRKIVMPDTTISCANPVVQPVKSAVSGSERQNHAAPQFGIKTQYFAVSPGGVQVPIPKELFVALLDFLKTRKCPGSIAIKFRSGEITCVEALARKTYRNNV